jgi:hypothetical protein
MWAAPAAKAVPISEAWNRPGVRTDLTPGSAVLGTKKLWKVQSGLSYSSFVGERGNVRVGEDRAGTPWAYVWMNTMGQPLRATEL